MTDAAAMAQEKLPMPTWAIWILCFLFPVIAGSVMYYAWKGSNPNAAKYANRASWISFGFWVVVGILRRVL